MPVEISDGIDWRETLIARPFGVRARAAAGLIARLAQGLRRYGSKRLHPAIHEHLVRWVKRRMASRDSDLISGDSYLLRWYVTPWKTWSLRHPVRRDTSLDVGTYAPLNVYLHRIECSDDDRALHDRPWFSLSVILKGGYDEVVPVDRADPAGEAPRLRRIPGDVTLRRPSSAHRLELIEGYCVSLFLMGPKFRIWGFCCRWGWRPGQDFVGDDPGQVGRGCD